MNIDETTDANIDVFDQTRQLQDRCRFEKRDSTVRNLSSELAAASSSVHENIQLPQGRPWTPTPKYPTPDDYYYRKLELQKEKEAAAAAAAASSSSIPV